MSGDAPRVSGDAPRVVLADGAELRRFLAALRALEQLTQEFTLIGGVAVVARIAEVHRATSDLDTVSADAGFRKALIALPSGQEFDDVLTVAGVRIDAVEVDMVDWAEFTPVDNVLDRLFAMAHLWALRDAVQMIIQSGPDSARVMVATVRALLATKLHALASPRREASKHGSDAWDVCRLAQVAVRDDASPIEHMPNTLRDAMRHVVEREWRANPEQFRQRVLSARPRSPVADVLELRGLADVLMERLAEP